MASYAGYEPEEIDKYDFSDREKEKIKYFLNNWENSAKYELEDLIKKLKKI